MTTYQRYERVAISALITNHQHFVAGFGSVLSDSAHGGLGRAGEGQTYRCNGFSARVADTSSTERGVGAGKVAPWCDVAGGRISRKPSGRDSLPRTRSAVQS